ncbi:winged helix-turn-helix domain-containing protein [Halorarum halobium]|uniref:winged helix-turn-helix domain-containing protein n=1 Tax=Halorarum halobium TaxID=3075121 RepID=UPI0028B0A48D|nr:winged helix-turn-helix domain-containing protein [Halobaculum sp. XH14]
MADDGDVTGVVDLLGDDYARTILTQTRREPKSVDALSDACEADPSTVYRRVQRLQAADLLEDHQRLDPDGHHYKVYAASVREVRVRLDEDGFEVDVERDPEENAADRFTRLYEGFK